jgi:hypothetical protein
VRPGAVTPTCQDGDVGGEGVGLASPDGALELPQVVSAPHAAQQRALRLTQQRFRGSWLGHPLLMACSTPRPAGCHAGEGRPRDGMLAGEHPTAFRTIPNVVGGMVHDAAGMVPDAHGTVSHEAMRSPCVLGGPPRGWDLELEQMTGRSSRLRLNGTWPATALQGSATSDSPLSRAATRRSPSSSATTAGPYSLSQGRVRCRTQEIVRCLLVTPRSTRR